MIIKRAGIFIQPVFVKYYAMVLRLFESGREVKESLDLGEF